MHRFNLIENALDSLEHAIEHLTPESDLKAGDFKRVILDLSHVAELLLKERLRRIHPAFVLSDVDKYPSCNAFSISAAGALQRLQRIGEIKFKDTDQGALRTIREKRNEIEHFEFAIGEDEAKVVIGDVLVFIFRFSSDELDLDWADRRLNDPKWAKLNEYAEFYEAQRAQVVEELSGTEVVTLPCAKCRNDTFDVESEVCLLCGYREKVQRCSRCQSDYLYSEVEFEDMELCPDCEWQEGYAAANFEKY